MRDSAKMPTQVLMPALSPTMEQGKLAKWLVKEGDEVKAGMVIAEIETDKATMEVEAVDEGVISAILVAAGSEGVKVNTPIARLGGEGEAAAPAAPAAASLPARFPGGGKCARRMGTVLVVEDHPDTCRMMARLLAAFGHRADCALSGEAALAHLAAAAAPPDVVLLDAMMPGMDGVEVLRRLRADPRTARLPVVMCSAVSDPAYVATRTCLPSRPRVKGWPCSLSPTSSAAGLTSSGLLGISGAGTT